jgi:hypothetical protein
MAQILPVLLDLGLGGVRVRLGSSVLAGSWLTKYAPSLAGSVGSELSWSYGKIGSPMLPAP